MRQNISGRICPDFEERYKDLFDSVSRGLLSGDQYKIEEIVKPSKVIRVGALLRIENELLLVSDIQNDEFDDILVSLISSHGLLIQRNKSELIEELSIRGDLIKSLASCD